MDILGKYQQEHTEASPSLQKTEWKPSNDYGFFVRAVMKVSGGRIREERQANFVLLGLAGLAIILSLFLFFRGSKEIIPPKIMDDTFDQTIQN